MHFAKPSSALVISLIALVLAPAAGAAVSSVPQTGWVTDGPVNAVARSADQIFLGGSFSYVGPRTGPWVALSASSGAVDAAMPQVAGGSAQVYATVADGAGGFYLGGNFTHVGGLARNNVAHIRSDGTVDPAWDPNANGDVNALAVSGSTVYLGGLFNGANAINGSVTRNRAAAVDATTGVATGWNPDVGNGVVMALAVSGSTVYLGGNFSGANAINGSLTRNRAAAVDATTGVATAWNPNANGDVNALAVSDSTVYLGGSFNGANAINGSLTRNRLTAVDATTGVATAWDPNARGTVRTLALSGGVVAAGGYFSSLGGQPRRNAAALNAADLTLSSWDPNVNGTVTALAVSGSTVYLGGSFTGANAINGSLTRNRAAAVDATTGAATAWNPDANGTVTALAVTGSTVYLGGNFTGPNAINGSLTRNRAAAVDATTGVATAWNPDANCGVNALAVSGSTVYLGGCFSGANAINGSLTRNRAAAVDATTGVATAWNPDANDEVWALAVSGSTVYLGGSFSGTNAINGSLTRNRLAAVDATTGTATAWDPNANGDVNALAVSGSTVYLGGSFVGANAINGSLTRNFAAEVDATTGVATDWNPNANNTVSALTPDGPVGVIAGGEFTSIGTAPQAGIAVFREPPAPAPAGPAAPATGAPAVISAARIRASLLSQIIPRGANARIRVLLKKRGHRLRFTALTAGTALVRWYYLPKGARLAKARKTRPKPILVAAGRATFKAAGTRQITMRLTKAGTRLLRRARKLKLTAKGTFTPTGRRAITATRTFTLRR